VCGVAPEQAGQGRVVGETDDDVEIPDAALAAQVVLGAALGEGDEANAAAPGSEPGIAGEELVEFGVSEAAEALEIGLVERLTRACRIAGQPEVPPRRRTVRPVAGEFTARFTCSLRRAGPCSQRP